ncbi:MAG: zinc ribbon domain-containing protein [Bacteroidetes bacterium]|nr:zinc ribbon domain-containing protein [Bacteroidota bacterium]
MTINCDSCGARIGAGQTVCDLCGTSVGDALEATLVESEASSEEAGSSPETPSSTVFCNACGWANPTGSNFCSKCGTALQQLDGHSSMPKPRQVASRPPATPAASSDSNKAVGKQIGIIVMSALLIVFALYMVTTMSESSASSEVTLVPGTGEEEPLAAQFVGKQTELQDKMEGLSGDSLIAVKRKLVDLYFAAARFDLAGIETESIATLLKTEHDWSVAGNLYYDWMERKDPVDRTPWALKAIAAYGEALKINPLNVDVRTDMAIAYMYDPPNAMMAIQETNAVLEQDSLHLQANFNRGIMLMQIDRVDQAAIQFEKVMRLIGDENDPVYVRAKELAERLRSELAAPSS